MPHSLPNLAFVDIETTGGSAQADRITEIAVVCLDDEGGVHEWSTLVNPGRPIPRAIQHLTGITDAMVAGAPRFEDVAADLAARLDGHVFVAHNARFDHGFLKNAFARMNADFRTTVLCTVRLSRRLYPDVRGHGLDALIQRHGLSTGEAGAARHRALGDARAILQFWRHVNREFSPQLLAQTVRKLCALPSLPPALPAELPDSLPRTPGVYCFIGENDAPLYIGKAIDLRRRVLSHFSGDHARVTSMELSRQVRNITWTLTASELEALLVESSRIKAQAPLYNRQLRPKADVFSWQLTSDLVSGRLALSRANDPLLGVHEGFHGLFSSRAKARHWLRALVDEHGLCPVQCGVEKQTPGRPCFSRQLGRCLGACVDAEPAIEHFARLQAALAAHRVDLWPYPGAMMLPGHGTLHVLNRWAYVGAAADAAEAWRLACAPPPRFDPDVYQILRRDAEGLVPVVPVAA